MRGTLLRLTMMAAGLAALSACNSGTDTAQPSAFDRRALLTHAADHYLIPTFARLSTSAQAQQVAIARLAAQPTDSALRAARARFRIAFLDAQRTLCADFGPGRIGNDEYLSAHLLSFPANEAQIQAAIAAGMPLNPNSPQYDRRGFAALDYLLFADSATTLQRFAASPALRRYTQQVADEIAARALAAADAWPAYRATFVASDGIEAGSPTGEYYNAFVWGYEWSKNYKVALPAGRGMIASDPSPLLAEARYSGMGRAGLLACLDLYKQIYTGDFGDQKGPGWDDYLATVPGGPELTAATLAQYATVERAAAALPAGQDLSQVVASPQFQQLSVEMQRHTRLFKADMSSLLGISITFYTGDGD